MFIIALLCLGLVFVECRPHLSEREVLVTMAKVAKETERYDDMATAMKKLAKMAAGPLTVDERNLLSDAYKNVVGAKRTAWRTVENMEQKFSVSQDTQSVVAKKYRLKIEAELKEVCNEVLQLLDNHLLKRAFNRLDAKESSENAEAVVFFLKMKGDYNRYLAEFTTDPPSKEQVIKKAEDAYKKALKISEENLKTTNPIRLGVALNYSVFLFEIRDKKEDACAVAKKAYESAVAELDSLNDDQYKDSTLIMQLLLDNLKLWTAESENESENEWK